MNITIENNGDLMRLICLKIDESDYKENVDASLRKYRQQAQFPGFRPGKAPMGMVKKLHGVNILSEEINKIISEQLFKYIEDEKLDIFGQPLANNEKSPKMDFAKDSDFTFYFDVALQPKVEVDLEEDKFDLDFYKIVIDQETEDKYLEEIKKRHGKQTTPEAIELNDIVYGDFKELDEEGNVVENGIAHSSMLLPETIVLKTVQKKFIGKKIADVIKFNPMRAIKNETEVASMLDITKEQAKDLKTEFSFVVTNISRQENAELNDEFFETVYKGTIKNEEELRGKIKEDALKSYTEEADKKILNDAVKLLMEKAKIVLPDEFIKRWLMENNEGKITAEQLDVQYPTYSDSLRWQILESKLIEKYDIKVTEDDAVDYIKFLMTNGVAPDEDNQEAKSQLTQIAKSYLEKDEEKKRIFDKLFDDRFTSLFKEKMNLTEKEISVEEFIKLVQENN